MSAYIYDAVRTPRGRGKSSGSLFSTRPVELAKTVLEAVVQRNSFSTEHLEDVIFGCVTPVGEQGADIAKLACQYAGFSNNVAGVQLNRFCASGLEAVNTAAAHIIAGISDLVIAGGVESMSRIPLGSDGGAWMADPDVASKTMFVPQGISADLMAELYHISRREADQFALQSQKKAALAWKENRFQKSIVPVKDRFGYVTLAKDEYLRPETTLADLETLKPSFQELGEKYGFDSIAIAKYPQVQSINHIHHAGNSSGIVDGAAAVLLGNKDIGLKLNLKPRAKIRSMAVVSTEPTVMLTGPAPSTRKALKKAGMNLSDIDLFEINEAFAGVVIHAMRDLEIDAEKVNVNGGSIALGHPLGATGAMLIGTVLDELERTDRNTGLVTLCVGGGMGVATVIERV